MRQQQRINIKEQCHSRHEGDSAAQHTALPTAGLLGDAC